jgi:hypothetical protein
LHFDITKVYSRRVEAIGVNHFMAEGRIELPQGTLDLLILKALALESMHGWAISERLQQISREALQVTRGRYILPCIDWSAAAGSRRTGLRAKIIAGPSTTR